MFFINKSIREGFPFIKQILLDSIHTESNLFTYPYENLSSLDYGFRKMIWKQQPLVKPFKCIFNNRSDYRLIIIKSYLGFYNIIAYVSLGDHPDFIGIGPFRDENANSTALTEILNSKNFSTDFKIYAEKFYTSLPIVSANNAALLLNHLITAFIPEFENVTPEYINYTEEKHEIMQSSDTMVEYSFKNAETHIKYLNNFLDSLINKNTENTLDALTQYCNFCSISQYSSVFDLRRFVFEVNSSCKNKLLETSIHPFYILKLHDECVSTIRVLSSAQKLYSFLYDMAKKYSVLAKNNSIHYSYHISHIINYISHNLSSELSLSLLAKEFNRNASSLSAEFSKETGKCITDWIHEQRINKAIDYFNTTELSVSEVSSLVGIHDFAYFSRLFKKYTGSSPNSYKKMMKRSQY